MKIILSRKAFDASSGGVPSPILPDGRLVPLPIPAKGDPRSYGEVSVNGMALGALVEDLTSGRIAGRDRCHLDPDLDGNSLPRPAGWRPAFGQINAAQSHLARLGIGKGDLFLFFGWFREAERASGRWRFVTSAPDLHLIYGWMQVGEVIGVAQARRDRLAPFADHPHLLGRDHPSNTLYLARERLLAPLPRRQGAGLFETLSEARILTDRRQKLRSRWRLPAAFHPRQGAILSYHEALRRWQADGEHCSLVTVTRGQEFVLAGADPAALLSWVGRVFGG